jgi:hypothetical protein
MAYVPIHFAPVTGPVVAIYRTSPTEGVAFPAIGVITLRDISSKGGENVLLLTSGPYLTAAAPSSYADLEAVTERAPEVVLVNADLHERAQNHPRGVRVVENRAGYWFAPGVGTPEEKAAYAWAAQHETEGN